MISLIFQMRKLRLGLGNTHRVAEPGVDSKVRADLGKNHVLRFPGGRPAPAVKRISPGEPCPALAATVTGCS